MKEICLNHDAEKVNGVWIYLHEDVAEKVRKEQTPVTVVTCPKCQEKVERIKKFLSH